VVVFDSDQRAQPVSVADRGQPVFENLRFFVGDCGYGEMF
jgi:hypothetical protein